MENKERTRTHQDARELTAQLSKLYTLDTETQQEVIECIEAFLTSRSIDADLREHVATLTDQLVGALAASRNTDLLRQKLLKDNALILSQRDQLQAQQVIGHLHALWHSVLEQQENGDLTDWPDDMIAQAAAYTGSASTFVSSLQSRKWLDGKIIHDWMDYAGRYLLIKYRTSNPKRLLQIQKLHQSVSKPVSSPTKVRPKSDNLTRPNHPNQTNPKKESPVRATVNEVWLAELKKNAAYQHINWAVEFGKMDIWLAKPGNEKRKKTPSFILNWLNKIEAPLMPTETPQHHRPRPTGVVL